MTRWDKDSEGLRWAYFVLAFLFVACLIYAGIEIWKRYNLPDNPGPPPTEERQGVRLRTEMHEGLHEWYYNHYPELLTARQRYNVRIRQWEEEQAE